MAAHKSTARFSIKSSFISDLSQKQMTPETPMK